jgi:hypothetical protein
MKSGINKQKIAVLIAFSSLALLTGCGKSPESTAPTVGGVPGMINGYAAGCVPIATTTLIPFTATNMFLGMYDTHVRAGAAPGGQPYGTVILGGAPVVPTYANSGMIQYQGQRVDGTSIQLNVTSPYAQNTGYPPAPGYTPTAQSPTVNATGTIQLSTQIQQLLLQIAQSSGAGSYGNYYPGAYNNPGNFGPGLPNQQWTGQYPTVPANTAQTCLSGLAIDLQHGAPDLSYARWLYMGKIYFYLNGQQHGLALDF